MMQASSPDQLYTQALQFTKEDLPDKAIPLLEAAANQLTGTEDPVLIFNIYYYLGLNAAGLDDFEKAMTYYHQAIEVCPNDSLKWLPYYGLGYTLSSLDRLQEAIEPYSIALQHCEEPGMQYAAHTELADAFLQNGDIKKVIEHHKIAFNIAKENGFFDDMMGSIYELGNIYTEFDYGQEARDLLVFGLETARKNARRDWERTFIGNLSTAYLETNELEKAKQLAEKLLEIGKETGEIDDKTTALNNLAMYHRAKGEYRLGIDYLKQAIKIEDNLISKAIEYRNLSRFYEEVGEGNLASYYLMLALEIVEREQHWEKIVKYRFQAGDLHFARENYLMAIQYYESCLEAFKHYPENETTVEVLTHIGTSWSRLDEFEKGLEYIEKALEKAEEVQASDRMLSIVFNALAGMYLREDYFEEADEYYQLSLRLDDDPQDTATVFNMAAFYHMTGEYDKAETLINQAIKNYEEQRIGMEGFDLKFFDNLNGNLYEYLAAIKARKGQLLDALKAIEKLKSRALLEEFGDVDFSFEMEQMIASLSPDESILYYVNAQHNNPLVLCLTSEGITSQFLPLSELRDSLTDFEGRIERYLERLQHTNSTGNTYAKANIPHPGWFDSVILYYRHRLLQDPRLWPAKQHKTNQLARLLHDYLVQPFVLDLEGKKKLTIVPDRSLYILPFETLINDSNRYLVEEYDVAYLPNLSLRKILADRQYQFQKNGLALGISHYDELKNEQPQELSSSEEIPMFRMSVASAIQEGENLDPFYKAIGVKNWPSLPYVESELKHFRKLLPGAEMVYGNEFTPRWLQFQSEQNRLKAYRILHFANHGIAIPAIPELSGMVTAPDPTGNRYINADNISALKIAADLVCLSACETGLGEVIPSIGVIGLAQPFFRAGAKSVQVSLWEINDAVSLKMMECFYTVLNQTTWDYAHALAKTKRKCIAGNLGEDLENPLYWATLVWLGMPGADEISSTRGR